MISLITAILGALTGMVPGVLQFFTMKATNAQQLELRKLELQAAREGTALQVDLANAQSDIQQQQQLYNYAREPSGVRWVDALNTLIRPYITIIVFHVWIGVEITIAYYGFTRGGTVEQIAKSVWDENTQAVFSAIVGFWFGNRMLTRGNEHMAATMALTKPTSVTVTPGAGPAGAPAVAVAHTSPPATPPSGVIPKPPGSRD